MGKGCLYNMLVCLTNLSFRFWKILNFKKQVQNWYLKYKIILVNNKLKCIREPVQYIVNLKMNVRCGKNCRGSVLHIPSAVNDLNVFEI